MLIEDYLKIKRTSRNTIWAALIIITVLALYNWVVIPHTRYLETVRRCDAVSQDVTSKSEVIENTLKNKNIKLQTLRKQVNDFESSLFTAEEARKFFGSLQGISEQAGCMVNSITFGAANIDSKRQRQPDNAPVLIAKSVVLNVSGSYDNIISLTEKLNLDSRKVWIDSVNIRRSDIDASRLKCDITITIYAITDKELSSNV